MASWMWYDRFRIPSHLQVNHKSPISNHKSLGSRLPGHWSLLILWSLAVGDWSFLLLSPASAAPATPRPLVHAHAHNDYEHARPLLDALDHGFCSIEADVWLVDGNLLVAHDRDKVKPDRTLRALYLDPLRERVRRNGGGRYPAGPPAILLTYAQY